MNAVSKISDRVRLELRMSASVVHPIGTADPANENSRRRFAQDAEFWAITEIRHAYAPPEPKLGTVLDIIV